MEQLPLFRPRTPHDEGWTCVWKESGETWTHPSGWRIVGCGGLYRVTAPNGTVSEHVGFPAAYAATGH